MAKRALKIKEEDFPGNSNTGKIAPTREDNLETVAIEKMARPERLVRRRKAIVKKKSIVQSIAAALVGDSPDNVGGYVLHEVLIPAAKNTIQEMVQSGIEMLLFGERRSKYKDRDHGPTKISYGSYYKERDHKERPRATYRDKFDLSEIYFDRGDDAAEVLDSLSEILEEYDQVTVADFFDTAGISGSSWAHNKYGWTDSLLRKAYCTHRRGGYQIIFPEPIELD